LYDPASGQLMSGSFTDYYMPRAGLIRDIRMFESPVESKANILGAKGVGESGCTASLPTLANAVMDALRPIGVPELEMPFTPSKVWQAINAAKQAANK
jgi:carbon-monoxide dehydrogenase large subunit